MATPTSCRRPYRPAGPSSRGPQVRQLPVAFVDHPRSGGRVRQRCPGVLVLPGLRRAGRHQLPKASTLLDPALSPGASLVVAPSSCSWWGLRRGHHRRVPAGRLAAHRRRQRHGGMRSSGDSSGTRSLSGEGDPLPAPNGPHRVLATPLRLDSLADVRIYPSQTQIDAAARAASRQGGAGSVFSGLAKPPLDPLVMVPVASQSSQVRALWTLLAAAVFAVLLGIAAGRFGPPPWPPFSRPTTSLARPSTSLASATLESVAYLLIALAVLWIRRPIVSAVCLALAVGSNELAFFSSRLPPTQPQPR